MLATVASVQAGRRGELVTREGGQLRKVVQAPSFVYVPSFVGVRSGP